MLLGSSYSWIGPVDDMVTHQTWLRTKLFQDITATGTRLDWGMFWEDSHSVWAVGSLNFVPHRPEPLAVSPWERIIEPWLIEWQPG
jgi:hypothetical protein